LVSTLAASLENHAENIGAAFRRLTEGFLQPGETLPDVVLVVRLLGRLILDRFGVTLTKDRIDFDERANDLAPRSERDDASNVLHSKLVDVRRISDVMFGPEFSRTLVPILGTTATVPVQVLRQGEHTLERLGEAPPPPRIPGVSADLSEWAQDLAPHVERLRSTLGVLDMAKNKASATVEEKKQSMKEFDFLYSHVVNIVRGFLFLARLDKAAQELPALNRRRRSSRGPVVDGPPVPDVEPPPPPQEALPAAEAPEVSGAEAEDAT
jgi:hypothetical protein